MLGRMATGTVRTWDQLGPFERLCRSVGGKAKLARALGISRQALFCWHGIVPAHWLDECVRLAGGVVSARDLRPDLFGKTGRLKRERYRVSTKTWRAARAPKPASKPRRRAGRTRNAEE